MKNVLWRVAKGLSYIEDTRCLKVKPHLNKQYNQSFRNTNFIKTALIQAYYV